MQGLILAAGMGTRLKYLTADNTKCMAEVNGITIIDRMMHQLEKLNLSRIVVVTGYESEKLTDYISRLELRIPICYVNNPDYGNTNNIYSLALAEEYLIQDDTLLLESDLIFEDSVLAAIVDDKRQTLALVDKYESWMDGTCVKLRGDDSIETFILKKDFSFDETENYYKTVNIYKFSKSFSATHFVPFLDAYIKAFGKNAYYEEVLRIIVMQDDSGIQAKRLDGERWYEIDDIQDLDIAASMFTDDGDMRADNIESRYGGYWRYPDLLDFCYLMNAYYPPKRLMDEMKASFDKLLTQYPSGMKVNSLLAAKNFGIYREHILVGNGAAELIKYLMDNISGKVGFIRPTFEEYPNRHKIEDTVSFFPGNADFRYTADDLIGFFDRNAVENLVIVNPDNPSGNYIKKADLLRLINWCKEKQMRLIVDESFVDFADEENGSLIDEDIISEYENLVIIKSISKLYGIPGARLGVMVSSDTELLAGIAKDAAIWNINSFAEFYMQIAGKYKNDYAESLDMVREARREFTDALGEIPHLRAIPSQANYVMAEITGEMTARELTKNMLLKHNMLIKDLSAKVNRPGKEFVRLALRSREDNAKLINALKEEL